MSVRNLVMLSNLKDGSQLPNHNNGKRKHYRFYIFWIWKIQIYLFWKILFFLFESSFINSSSFLFLSFGFSIFNFEQMLNADTREAFNKTNEENKLKLFYWCNMEKKWNVREGNKQWTVIEGTFWSDFVLLPIHKWKSWIKSVNLEPTINNIKQ